MAGAGRRAWLITWDNMGFDHWGGEHGKVVAALPSRLRFEHVRAVVVSLWCTQPHFDASDRIFYGLDKDEQKRMTLQNQSDSFCDHFWFGRKPFLYARKVTQLRYIEKNGTCTIRWREKPHTIGHDPNAREAYFTKSKDASWSETRT